MRPLLVLLLCLAATSCGSVDADPETCQNGVCIDPQFPFCDVNGEIGGTPGACIAIECVPGTVASCQQDMALSCNAAGNDYELVACPNGCELPNGCKDPVVVECTTNAQCDNPSPVCSAEMVCRGCALDDECDSGVCDVDTGACANASEVLYATPTGGDSAQCVAADPCSLPRAVSLATSNPLRPWIKLAPGNYDRQVQTNVGAARIVGPRTAVLRGDSPSTTSGTISVGMGGKVTIRGVSIDLTKQSAYCGGVGTTGFLDGGELHLRDVAITSPASNGVFFSNGCVGSIVHSAFDTMSGGIFVFSQSGHPMSRATIDRFHYRATGTTASFQVNMTTITNSLFEGVALSLTGSNIAFSTVYGGQIFAMEGRVENSIVLAPGNANALFCTSCTSRTNIAFPQMATIAGTTAVDPQLVDAPNHDLHLKATSPALNAAMPQPDLTTAHDFDGASRPQGGGFDIGAYERAP